MEEESYFKVRFPDGRTVDIMTTEGADEFIGNGAPFIESNLGQAQEARNRLSKGNISNQERRSLQDSLVHAYLMFGYVANNASEQGFANVGQGQVDGLISHVSDIFSALSTSKRWTKTGVLQKYDQELLDSLICFMKHLLFVNRVLSSDLLSILASFCAARQDTEMPCPTVTETILSIVNNFRVTLSIADWEGEKIFKVLESSGLLAQVFRCITQPSPDPDAIVAHLVMMDELMACQSLVRKKLKPGQPTGDVLASVIAGNNGYKGRRDERVMTRLCNMQRMTTVLNDKHVSEDGIDMIGKVCRYCDRADMTQEFQARLLACSRCKDTYYCSKEHQLADWKVHKKVCHPPDRALEKATKGSQDSIMSFVMSNYYDIMKEIVRITQDEGIDKRELVLEIDFFANKGSAPALRDPAEFKIGITSRYLQGDRPDEPDWFHKGTSVYDDNIKMFIAGLTDHYRRMTNDRLLTVTRYASGSSGVYRVLLMTEVGGTPLFSDDALDAFARAMNNDDSRLEQVYGNKSNAITVRRDMEMRDRRMQQVMRRHPDGGASFLADMARLRVSLDAFVASDRYNDLVDNLSEESGDDYDDDEYESAEEEDVDDLS